MIKTIRLQQITVPAAKIGAHEWEKNGQGQPMTFDISLKIDPTYRVVADDLAEAVDYDFVRPTVVKAVTETHVQLQETVVQRIVEGLFSHDQRIVAVSVRSCKPLIYPDCEGVSYEIDCTREMWSVTHAT